MSYKFIEPDFKNSNLNISATIAEFLGAENKNATISELKKELEKGYKYVVFICFDGLGINPININLEKDSILRKNIVKTLVSTFPSTTTNATTSLATNLLPLEHGWFGWSLHFDEINRNIDIYLHRDSQTEEQVDFEYPLVDNTNYYFDNGNSDYNINTVFMPYCKVKHEERNVVVHNEIEMCDAIAEILKKPGKQFVYAYLDNPDATMHEFGVTSAQSKEIIESINSQVQKLYDESRDTLFVITADHGQIDVAGYVEFYKDSELNGMLKCVPFLEGRAPAFIVKEDKKEEFKKRFTEKYGEDFVLFESKNLVDKGYFGDRGDKAYLLGDFIAIGTDTNKQFLNSEIKPRFKGHHTSLTKEMEVPLILIAKK